MKKYIKAGLGFYPLPAPIPNKITFLAEVNGKVPENLTGIDHAPLPSPKQTT
jgi:hypothetical protein